MISKQCKNQIFLIRIHFQFSIRKKSKNKENSSKPIETQQSQRRLRSQKNENDSNGMPKSKGNDTHNEVNIDDDSIECNGSATRKEPKQLYRRRKKNKNDENVKSNDTDKLNEISVEASTNADGENAMEFSIRKKSKEKENSSKPNETQKLERRLRSQNNQDDKIPPQQARKLRSNANVNNESTMPNESVDRPSSKRKRETAKTNTKLRLEEKIENESPSKDYILNEIVLCAIPGYPPWPARIIDILNQTIFVEFFGTGQM